MARETVRIPIDDIDGRLEEGFKELDQTRAAALGELAEVNDVRLRVLERDHKRLAEKLGEGHPRVAALSRSLEMGKAFGAEVRLEQAAASLAPPKVGDHSWVLRGRVLDARRRPLKGLTVALFEGDQPLPQFGAADTDGEGHFELKARRVEGGPQQASVRVLRGERVVHVEDAPVAVRPGHSDFLEIVVDPERTIPRPPRGPGDAPPPDR